VRGSKPLHPGVEVRCSSFTIYFPFDLLLPSADELPTKTVISAPKGPLVSGCPTPVVPGPYTDFRLTANHVPDRGRNRLVQRGDGLKVVEPEKDFTATSTLGSLFEESGAVALIVMVRMRAMP